MRGQKTVPARSARVFEIIKKMEKRTGWREQNESHIGGKKKRSGRLVGAAGTSKKRAERRRPYHKNLNILHLLKRKKWPQCQKESSWQVRRNRLCQKEKDQSRMSRVSNHEVAGSQDEREPHLDKTGRSEREHEEERVGPTMKEGKFRGED